MESDVLENMKGHVDRDSDAEPDIVKTWIGLHASLLENSMRELDLNARRNFINMLATMSLLFRFNYLPIESHVRRSELRIESERS